MSTPLVIGVDFGGTNIKAALVDLKGRIVSQHSCASRPGRGPDAVIGDMAGLVHRLISLGTKTARDTLTSTSSPRGEKGFVARIQSEPVIGVGLGCPGPLDIGNGVILRSANLPGWKNVAIRDLLQSRTGLPVVMDNDANAAAYGEFWAGAGGDGKDLVLLTLGTGVGGGVVINGRVLHGHFDNAAELGHMIVETEGLPCPCGQRGCLEQYASAAAVARRVQSAIEEGQTSRIAGVTRSGDGASIDSKTVAECAKAGDALCRRIWDEACKYLAVACVNIQHALNPARIILGGGMAEAGEFLLIRVQDHFQGLTWSLAQDAPQITLASLGYDAGVVGAAGLALQAHGMGESIG